VQRATVSGGPYTSVGSVTTAFIIAAPRTFRPAVAAIGVFVVALECMAVVALQWHNPSDALAGAVFGAGMVLLVDGVLHLEVGAARRRRGPTVPGDPAG